MRKKPIEIFYLFKINILNSLIEIKFRYNENMITNSDLLLIIIIMNQINFFFVKSNNYLIRFTKNDENRINKMSKKDKISRKLQNRKHKLISNI